MNERKKFTVTLIPANFWMLIMILGLFVMIVLAYTIFSPPPHTAMYVSVTIFVFIPISIVAVWVKTLRIRVNGTRISVRKKFGLTNFDLDVSDIVKVEWKIVDTKFGQNEMVKVFALKGKKFTIESLMVNSDKMIKYMEENIDEEKINRVHKSFK